MKELKLSIQDVKALMESFSKNGIGSLHIQQGDFQFKLDRIPAESPAACAEGRPQPPVAPPAQPVASAPSAPSVQSALSAQPEPAEPEVSGGNVVPSPIVGTFYAAPSQDKEAFVHVGSQVRKGDVLFIIESMKLMNEVTSSFDGVVSKIHVQNGQGVEYGQPILTIV